jgi:hypothetical protein
MRKFFFFFESKNGSKALTTQKFIHKGEIKYNRGGLGQNPNQEVQTLKLGEPSLFLSKQFLANKGR